MNNNVKNLSLSIIVLFVGATKSASPIPQQNLVLQLQSLAETIQNLSAQQSNNGTNGCALLAQHEDSIKSKSGGPAFDVTYEWELKRRDLAAKCAFENVVESHKNLASAVQKWDIALQKVNVAKPQF